jgi:hypothetical protein
LSTPEWLRRRCADWAIAIVALAAVALLLLLADAPIDLGPSETMAPEARRARA